MIDQWLHNHSRKESRPADREDIIEELITALRTYEPLWREAKPSQKKTTKKRYKSLCDAFEYQREKFDALNDDKPKRVPSNRRPPSTRKQKTNEMVTKTGENEEEVRLETLEVNSTVSEKSDVKPDQQEQPTATMPRFNWRASASPPQFIITTTSAEIA